MLLIFVFLIFQSIQAQPTTCVTCINCQDVYDGTDINLTCSSTVPNANSCQKTRIQLPGIVMVSKACASNCKENAFIGGSIRLDVTCCTTSNCNIGTLLQSQSVFFHIFICYFILINKN